MPDTTTKLHGSAINSYDLESVRADFPILEREVHGKPLVYLDNAASAQKPRAVIDAMSGLMERRYANVHRGLHHLSGVATDAFEGARETVRRFINAGSTREIVFTKGGTEAINLVAQSFGRDRFQAGDEIIVSAMEHHANIVPWQLLRAQTGVVLKVAPIDEDGLLDLAALEALIGPRTRLLAITHASNVLGTVTPAKRIVALAHAHGVPVLLDGSQAVVHMPVDVRDLDVDFYTFTGHKLYGPTGIGVLYGKEARLEAMPPYQGGGDMILSVSFEETVFNSLPHKFEAGTPPIVEAVGLAAAIDYLQDLGLERIARHEDDVRRHAEERLVAIPGVRLYGRAPGKAAIVSFTLDGVHSHDVGTLVDRVGVAIRVGHHCAQPLMERFGVAATARASIGLYNTSAEVDTLVKAVDEVRRFFA